MSYFGKDTFVKLGATEKIVSYYEVISVKGYFTVSGVESFGEFKFLRNIKHLSIMPHFRGSKQIVRRQKQQRGQPKLEN